jgi:hypothetical protein
MKYSSPKSKISRESINNFTSISIMFKYIFSSCRNYKRNGLAYGDSKLRKKYAVPLI